MRIASLMIEDRPCVAAETASGLVDLSTADASLGPDVGAMLESGRDWQLRAERALGRATVLDRARATFRPLIPRPPKFICLGLNDVDHANEAGLPIPETPVIFSRVSSSLIGHQQPMLQPAESSLLDFEAELAVVIGVRGRRIEESHALEHVAGYTAFNDGSIRDVQLRTSQWTLGKNFHGTGALGPFLVTADALPAGAEGLRITTRVGDDLLQDGNTSKMIFSVARTIALLSEAMVLEPGDVIAMGTPSGIGHARKPPRYLEPGQTCRVEIEQIGMIENPIAYDDARISANDSGTREDDNVQPSGARRAR